MNFIKKIFTKIWSMKWWLKILLLVIIAAAVYLFLPKNGKIYYETAEVVRGDIVDKVEASGTINPVSQTNVGTQVSGIIYKLYVDFNTPVKKGAMLAEIDPATLEATLLQQEAALMKAESNMKNDERTYDRYKQLYKQDFVAKSELDSAETQYLSSKASYIQAKASVDKAKTDLQYTKITSPVDGIVISRAVDLGQTVAASFQTPTLFIVAQDLTKMQIEVKVSEADIIAVKEGQRVTFNIDGYPGEEFAGKVNQVRLSAETVQGMVAYTVVISVDNSDLKLKPGMTANITIITNEKNDVLLVSNSALRYSPASSTEKFRSRGVWLLKNGAPVRVEITPGIMDDRYTEIASGGVQDGDMAITMETTSAKQAKSLFGANPPNRNQQRREQAQRR